MSIIEAKNLNFTYEGDTPEDNVTALRDVSFEIEDGSFVAILGRNGSGKSTLAKLLCMVMSPDIGKLLIDGVDVSREGVTEV